MTRASKPPRDPTAPNAPEVEAAYAVVPPEQVAEILDGELFVMPRPKPRHSNAMAGLTAILDGPFRRGRGGPGGWLILIEPELHLGPKPDKVVPDLAGWRQERFPREVIEADADTEPAAITVAPDWICEILSEGTEAIDRGKKMRIYRRERVGYLWFLDPRSQSLEVYRLNARGRWEELETYEEAVTVRAEPFEAIELELASLFHW